MPGAVRGDSSLAGGYLWDIGRRLDESRESAGLGNAQGEGGNDDSPRYDFYPLPLAGQAGSEQLDDPGARPAEQDSRVQARVRAALPSGRAGIARPTGRP